MNYTKPCKLDDNKKAKICPTCHNQEIKDGDIYPICGTYLINKCSGYSVDYFNDEVDGSFCNNITDSCKTLPSNARYCSECGAASTFFLQGILPVYVKEMQTIKDENPLLKAIN